MKTLDEVYVEYKSQTLDGRDLHRLMGFIPEADLHRLGLELKPEYVGTHEHSAFTRENVLTQLEKDVAFGFEKALNRRGISAGLMTEVVQMWNWILQDGLEDFDYDDSFAQYGLPIFRATAVKYGFDNPIGDDVGNEDKYASEGEVTWV